MKYFKACAAKDLSPEKITTVSLDGVSVCVVQSQNGEVFAFENKCSHEDKPLAQGKWDSATCLLTCPFHQAVFCVAQKGAVQVGPAVLPLQVLPVELREEGSYSQVYVGLDDED